MSEETTQTAPGDNSQGTEATTVAEGGESQSTTSNLDGKYDSV